jgi:hypothetical protein
VGDNRDKSRNCDSIATTTNQVLTDKNSTKVPQFEENLENMTDKVTDKIPTEASEE